MGATWVQYGHGYSMRNTNATKTLHRRKEGAAACNMPILGAMDTLARQLPWHSSCLRATCPSLEAHGSMGVDTMQAKPELALQIKDGLMRRHVHIMANA